MIRKGKKATGLRKVTEEEEELIRWMLEHGSEEARGFLPQVQDLRASSSCSCGCPTIKLEVDSTITSVNGCEKRIISDHSGRTAIGELVGVILFQQNGQLSELEAYSIDGEITDASNSYGWPLIDTLTPN